MSGTDWGTGSVDFVVGKVYYFENDGIVWYDALRRIERPGWQAELEHYEGTGYEGLPFDHPALCRLKPSSS